MKAIKYILATVATLMMMAASCEKPAPPAPESPVFPDLVEIDAVAPGSVLTLTFTPNLDWQVKLPRNQWFWIDDAGFKEESVSGKASTEPVSIQIGVSSEIDYDESHSCEVTLTMDGQSQVIAKYSTAIAQRSLVVYSGVLDEYGAFAFEGEGYMYSADPVESLELFWPIGQVTYSLPIKVVADFNWTMVCPSWLEAVPSPSGQAGETAVRVVGIEENYPLDGATEKIQFKAGDKVVKEIEVTIPSVSLLNRCDSDKEVEIMSDGQYVNFDGSLMSYYTCAFTSVKGLKIFAASFADGAWSVGEDVDWVTIEESAWDDAGLAFQTRMVKFTFAENTGLNARAAMIFAVPASVTDFSESVVSAWTSAEIPADYQKYQVISFTQYSPYALLKLGSSAIQASENCSFKEMTPAHEKFAKITELVGTENIYEFKADKAGSYYLIPMNVEGNIDLKRYDAQFNKLEKNADFWVDADLMLPEFIHIRYGATEASEGLLVFEAYDSDLKFAIWCVF